MKIVTINAVQDGGRDKDYHLLRNAQTSFILNYYDCSRLYVLCGSDFTSAITVVEDVHEKNLHQ